MHPKDQPPRRVMVHHATGKGNQILNDATDACAGPLAAHRSVGLSQVLLCDTTQNVLSQKSEL